MQIEAVKNEVSSWAEQFKSNLHSIMEAGNSLGRTGGKGSGGKDEQKSPAVDRKELLFGNSQLACRSLIYDIAVILLPESLNNGQGDDV